MNGATQVRPSGTWRGEAFAHEAFVFSDEDGMAERCVPFAVEGLEQDQPVLVVASTGVRETLRDRLGSDVDRLAVIESSERWWRGGHATLAAYDRDLRALRSAGRPWRLIAEPVWLARDDGRVWSRYEAVANSCYTDFHYYSLCLHDRRRLAPEVIDAVLRTHPLIWNGSAPAASPVFEDAAAYLRGVEPPWSPRPREATTATVRTASEARAMVRTTVADGWHGRTDDVVLAVSELVANALRVADAADVSTWASNGQLVWEVADDGPGFHEPTAGYVPPPDDLTGGRGLWLARSLADDATVRRTGPGSAVRLYFRRRGGGPGVGG